MKGYDVSHHQNIATVQQLLSTKPDFMFHKITEGSTYMDSEVFNRVKFLKPCPMFFYHYLRADKNNAVGEVNNLVNALNQTMLKPNEYGVAIDVEYSLKTGGTKTTDFEYFKRFMTALAAKLPKRFIIYMPDTYSAEWYYWIREKDYGLWIARYRAAQPNHVCDFWQFTSKPVDTDIFYGDANKLHSYIGG